jgi:hypothetical protein
LTSNDFAIILAFSEKLRQGTFVRVMGDAGHRQEKLVDLILGF